MFLWDNVFMTPANASVSVTTINVNGIRAAFRNGLTGWLEIAQPDVMLLQEVRAEEDIAQSLLGDSWHVFTYPSQLKGRAGVSIAVRKASKVVAPADAVPMRGLQDDEDAAHSGRWIELVLDTVSGEPIRVVSTYFHAGALGTPKQDLKYEHLDAVSERLDALSDEGKRSGIQTLVGGDFNVARQDLDLKNWKGNHNKNAGALDQEIEYLERWRGKGWVDVVRELAGPRNGPYSWWSWRGRAFDNDAGWRIDYHYATESLAAHAHDFNVFRAPSWDTRFSDHAPVTVNYRLGW